MYQNKLLSGSFAAIGMMLLILDSQTSLEGAYSGVLLCAKTVIPSLFPFFFLSIWMNNALIGQRIAFLEPLGNAMGLPKRTSTLLVSSFLGGYPAGAQAVANCFRSGKIEKATAEKLLSFSNNAGPAFIFGMAGRMFREPWIPWLLWGIHILSAFVVSLLISEKGTDCPSTSDGSAQSSHAMKLAVEVTGTVCGWVILFRIVVTFLEKWILRNVSPLITVVCTGLLELSNGCCALEAISDTRLRFLVCSGMLALGGLCVTMQTASVIQGLKIKYYLIGKMLQCIISLLLGAVFLYRIWILLPVVFITISILVAKRKNNCGNFLPLRV